jgi:hypothetical protein
VDPAGCFRAVLKRSVGSFAVNLGLSAMIFSWNVGSKK